MLYMVKQKARVLSFYSTYRLEGFATPLASPLLARLWLRVNHYYIKLNYNVS